jgi:hypothetical protein
MADNKQGRDKQAHDTVRRQRERSLAAELERMDDPEPPVDESTLAFFETELESVAFPATGADLVEAVGDHALESADGTHTVAQLLPETDAVVFETPAAVRAQVQRPTVAGTMKRLLEAVEDRQNVSLTGSQWDAYEKTFLALRGISPRDDDEGLDAVADWILEQVAESGQLPGSRAVRRRAAAYCRANDYEIRADEWLGV